MRGARETLARFAPVIVFEHSPYTSVEKGYDPDEIQQILLDRGYTFASLDRRRLNYDNGLPQLPAGSSMNLLAVPVRKI